MTSHRLFRRIATAGFVSVLISGSAVALVAAPAGAAVTTVKCIDPAEPQLGGGTLARTWTVKFTTSSTAFGPAATVTFLGRSPGTAEFVDSGWQLNWLGIAATPTGEVERFPIPPATVSGNAAIKAQPVLSFLFPRVTSPNGRCTVYLLPYSLVPSSGQKAAWVGDSLVDRAAATLTDRQTLASQWDANGWKLEPDGLGGARFEPRRAVLRGLKWTAPKRIAISLGANDAIYLSFLLEDCATRSPTNQCAPGLVAAEQAKVVGAIHDGVGELKASGRCLILTTPPKPSDAFGVGTPLSLGYVLFAEWVGNLLRAEASTATAGKVTYFDWMANSASHHLPDGTDGDWYEDGDELHPNQTGNEAFINQTIAAVNAGCP